MDRYTGPPEDSAASSEAAESNLNNSQRMITVRMPDPLPQQLIEKLLKFVNNFPLPGLTGEEKKDARQNAVNDLIENPEPWLTEENNSLGFKRGYVGRTVKNKMIDILRRRKEQGSDYDGSDNGRAVDRLLTKLEVQSQVARLLDPMREHVLHTVNYISECARAFPRESMHFNPEDQNLAEPVELDQWNPNPEAPKTPRVRDIVAKLRKSWN
jgi:hypothetical protein